MIESSHFHKFNHKHCASFFCLPYDDKKGKDALGGILNKLIKKNNEKLPCLVVPSTLTLKKAQKMPQAPLMAATSETVPQIGQEAPSCSSYRWLLRHTQDPFELTTHYYCNNTLYYALSKEK
jgi:hypothetical protein